MPAATVTDSTVTDSGRKRRGAVILRARGITKTFPGVLAIRAGELEVRAGEIHALVGENGAGKSTLIKILTGAHPPDAGRIEWCGRPVRIRSPQDALRLGIAAIYQEFNLVPGLSVRENLFLGRERTRRGLIDVARERHRGLQVLQRLGAEIDLEAPTGRLAVAGQQLVETARAILDDARLLIMDEPTAALMPREVDRLFAVLAGLRGRGHGILFISHRIDEVFRIADRVTVMRDGETLGCWPTSELTRGALIEKMVGRPLEQEFPKQSSPPGAVVLELRDLCGGAVRGVGLRIHAGEVLGLAGLVGAGRSELARLIFGADRPAGGEIRLDGARARIRSPRDAIRQGICLLTEDRKSQGLVLGLSARENFALPNLGHWSRGGWIDGRAEARAFSRFVESLQIRIAGPEQPARHLSGGNQQKLLIARWLEQDARVVIFDEPTRGIDVGTKYEIYLLINALARRGKAILMISSELPEILGMSDRILVMREGCIAGEIEKPAQSSQEQILGIAVG
ncbi:MAG: ATP-binding cassette domain-containing protein [Candidatus Eisenbacteria bacterium]|nr:ATP-binding cassette domain-containing protein [Candidatus Eisenbacteria bacterium]